MTKMERIPKFRPLDFPSSTITHSSGFLLPYLFSFGITVLITGVGLLIRDLITPTDLVMPYLLGVVSIAIFWGRGAAIFASVLGVIAFDLFLVPPYLTFVVEDTEYIITFLSFFLVGVLISNLTARIKDQMLEAQERESRVTSLYHLSKELAVAYSLSDILSAIEDNIRNTFKQDVKIFLSDAQSKKSENPHFHIFPSPDSEATPIVSKAVLYTYHTGKPSGFGLEDFSEIDVTNFPLSTNTGTVGVISISANGLSQKPNDSQLQIYEAFANLSALAIERVYLDKQASQAQLLKAKEDLQSTLLNSVSHDFRTPLVTIIGTLSSLDSEIELLDKQTQQNLVRYALRAAEKLNRLVSNLLNMSRLESGALQLQLEPVDLQDLIGATLEDMKTRIDRQINISVPDHLPLISADFVLLQQVLMNLMENAIKYSPEDAPIDIQVEVKAQRVFIDILDRGVGIDEDEFPHIFNKFYRIKNSTKQGGTGLGLAIVKGIIDAHDEATIEVHPREGGGTVFRVGFPKLEFQQ